MDNNYLEQAAQKAEQRERDLIYKLLVSQLGEFDPNAKQLFDRLPLGALELIAVNIVQINPSSNLNALELVLEGIVEENKKIWGANDVPDIPSLLIAANETYKTIQRRHLAEIEANRGSIPPEFKIDIPNQNLE